MRYISKYPEDVHIDHLDLLSVQGSDGQHFAHSNGSLSM